MSNIEKINISSEQKRHYRSKPKRVGLELNLSVILSEQARFCTDHNCLGYDVKPDYDSFFEGLPYNTGACGNGWRSTWADCISDEGHKRSHHVTGSIDLRFWLSADRPSEILSESEAMRIIARKANVGRPWAEHLSFQQIIEARIQRVLDDIEAQKERCNIARQANHLIGWLTKQAREKAKTNIDFQARLDALKAEFQAEQEAMLAAMIDGELQQECDKSDTDWHPRAIELASQRAEENLGSAIPGFLGRSHEDVVKPQDVFPAEENSENVAGVA